MVLLTGASGFVGGHLVEALTTARAAHAWPVRALVRPGQPSEYLRQRGFEVVVGDLADPRSLRAAVEGVESVVHLVGLLREAPGARFESVVVEGTRSLVDAARAAGVRRFVYLSAVGASPTSACRYLRTKAAAEAAVRDSGLSHLILRAALLYGPGDACLSRFARQPLPYPRETRCAPLHVVDACAAVLAALERPAVEGTLDLVGPEAVGFAELLSRLSLATGRPLPHPRLPAPLANGLAWLGDRLLRLGWPAPLTGDELRLLEAQPAAVDPRAVTDALGVRPRGLDAGLSQAFGPQGAPTPAKHVSNMN